MHILGRTRCLRDHFREFLPGQIQVCGLSRLHEKDVVYEYTYDRSNFLSAISQQNWNQNKGLGLRWKVNAVCDYIPTAIVTPQILFVFISTAGEATRGMVWITEQVWQSSQIPTHSGLRSLVTNYIVCIRVLPKRNVHSWIILGKVWWLIDWALLQSC